MPQIDERQLKQQLRDGQFFRAYFIYGEEAYLKQYYAGLISKKCVTAGMEGFNLKKYDATEGNVLDDVYAAAQTLPAFGGYCCVLAKDFALDALADARKKEFAAFLADVPETSVVVFIQDTLEVNLKKNAKYKAVAALFEKHGAVLQLDRMDKASLSKMLMSAAVKRGCTLERNTAFYLIETAGDDLTVLHNEIEKLCNFRKSGEISKADIDAVCIRSLETTIFDLSRALIRKDGAKAFSILEKLFSEKERPELILGTLISAYVDMYRVKVALTAGEKSDYAALLFNYRNKEFRLRNAARDVQGLSVEALRQCLDLLNAADQKLKTRVISEKIILEKLLAELLRSVL